tara:strand:+ start:465 stop:917 length:453 start_codon:yes stop_codon:yes gene_type:complete
MGIFDRLFDKKASRKRTFKEIRYDKILTKQQNLILESSLAANEALKMEVKSLRNVLFSQEDLYRELGIEPLQPNNNNSFTPSTNGEFNTADLLSQIIKGVSPEKVPMGKVGLQAISEFLQSNSQEVNALGSHYIQQLTPKKQSTEQVITQ